MEGKGGTGGLRMGAGREGEEDKTGRGDLGWVPKGLGDSEQSSQSLSPSGCSTERRAEDRQSSWAQCT